MIRVRTLIDEQKLAKAIKKIEPKLKPEVVRLRYELLEEEEGGFPGIFFRVLLTDRAADPKRLGASADRVRNLVKQELDPFSSWGLFPYFTFRSKSEQDDLQEASWA